MVDANAVGPADIDLAEDLSAAQRAIGGDVEAPDVSGRAGVGDVEDFFVGGKCEPVGLHEITDERGRLPALRIVVIDKIAGLFAAFLLLGGRIIFQAVIGIGEGEGAIGFHDDVVGRVEFFPLKRIDECADGAVFFLDGDAAAAVFASDEATGEIEGVAVGVLARLAVGLHAGRGRPLFELIFRDVAEHEKAARFDPHGALDEVKIAGECRDLRARGHATGELSRVGDLEIGGVQCDGGCEKCKGGDGEAKAGRG